MKDYNEVANDVFQRRNEYENSKLRRETIIRRFSAAAVSIVFILLSSVGTFYVIASGLCFIDDFLKIFRTGENCMLSDGQQQYMEDAVTELGEKVTCGGYTITARGAYTDGSTACILLDIEAPEEMTIDEMCLILDTDHKKIFRGANLNSLMDIAGQNITYISLSDNDGKKNTASIMVQISCIPLNGSQFSFADGYPRTLMIERISTCRDQEPDSISIIAEGEWEFTIEFTDLNYGEVEILKDPLYMPIKEFTSEITGNATINSIRLKRLGLMVYYTIDEYPIQESGDFGVIQIVMKNGMTMSAFPRTSAIFDRKESGEAVFCCQYISQSPIVFEEIEHIIINGETVVSMPESFSEN